MVQRMFLERFLISNSLTSAGAGLYQGTAIPCRSEVRTFEVNPATTLGSPDPNREGPTLNVKYIR